MKSAPSFLVEWEPRWHGFVTSIRPALSRSKAPLVLECDVGFKPGRTTFASFLMHISIAVLVTLLFAHAVRLPAYEHANPYETFNANEYHIIYYRGDLPEMEDAGGAQAGLSGHSGGREFYHPTQTIRIARGNKLVDTVVDAPSIKLPRTNEAVANLLSLPSGAISPPPLSALPSITSKTNIGMQVKPVPAPSSAPAAKMPALPANMQVVPPSPSVGRQVAGMRLPELPVHAVPAPISASPRDVGYTPKMMLPQATVVAPPPSASLPVGTANVNGPVIASVQVVDIVPPAPSVSGSGSGKASGGVIGSALSALGSMLGSIGPGSVSAAAPSKGGEGVAGGQGGLGLIVSASPGGAIGAPNGQSGSIAMSPKGGHEAGLGGSGGGTGIGHGTGTGSGSSGNGPGSGTSGSGLGAGALYPGTSLGSGPGGSGSGQGKPGGVRGVTIEGSHVTLPSFATPAAAAGSPSHGPGEKRNAPPITVIATSRSGGALNLYGALKGAKVYTIYIDTAIGMAALQYAERAKADTDFAQDLTAPEPLAFNLPSDIPAKRVLLSCIIDKTGALKNIRILESARADVTSRVVAAIQHWRFRPVLRGEEPIEVDAILGFNIGTSH